nr:hypothetical protein [Pedobacter sp. ASV19]
MNSIGTKRWLLLAVLQVVFSAGFAQKVKLSGSGKSQWVYLDKEKLNYKTLPAGDRIMDFSYAGYMGGGVAIPDPKVQVVLSPHTGDNTDAIQLAINKVSQMPMENGFRGAVLLKEVFTIATALL